MIPKTTARIPTMIPTGGNRNMNTRLRMPSTRAATPRPLRTVLAPAGGPLGYCSTPARELAQERHRFGHELGQAGGACSRQAGLHSPGGSRGGHRACGHRRAVDHTQDDDVTGPPPPTAYLDPYPSDRPLGLWRTRV